LYIPKSATGYDVLKPLIGGTLKIKHIRTQWNEIMRLATSIQQGTVTASLMLRKRLPKKCALQCSVSGERIGTKKNSLNLYHWPRVPDRHGGRCLPATLNSGF